MINRRMNTLSNSPSVDFSKIKVGVKTLEDATLTLSRDRNNPYTQKNVVIQAIEDGDYEEMINISDYYYRIYGCELLEFDDEGSVYNVAFMPQQLEKSIYPNTIV